jgi:hypothetical protein
MLPIGAVKFYRWRFGGNGMFPTAQKPYRAKVCARGLQRDVQIRNSFSSLGHSAE